MRDRARTTGSRPGDCVAAYDAVDSGGNPTDAEVRLNARGRSRCAPTHPVLEAASLLGRKVFPASSFVLLLNRANAHDVGSDTSASSGHAACHCHLRDSRLYRSTSDHRSSFFRFQSGIVESRKGPGMHGPMRDCRTPRIIRFGRIRGKGPFLVLHGMTRQGEVRRMERCDCRGLPEVKDRILTLECLECKAGVVTCPNCGKLEWWPSDRRRFALNAAEAHRWQTGHSRVVARGFGAGYEGHIVMEVGGE